MENPTDLRITPVRPGDSIRADSWNAIIRLISPQFAPFADSPSRWFPVKNTTANDIHSYGAFGIHAGTVDADNVGRPLIEVGQYGDVGVGDVFETTLILTNGEIEIPAGTSGLARIVGVDIPTPLIADGPITVGSVCGASTAAFKVSASSQAALVAITSALDGTIVWCVRNHMLGWVAGTVTSEITARVAGNLGNGEVELVSFAGTTQRTVTAYNPYGAVIPVGTWVTVVRDFWGQYILVGADCP